MKDPLGSDMYDKVQEDTNWLEGLMRKIPGFKGYLEMRDRREADQLVRETIAARLEEVRLQFSQAHEELSRDIIKAIDYAEPLGRIDNRLMGLIGKIKDAPEGYSGFFDAVKVNAEELEAIYQFDSNMMLHADAIATSVDALLKSIRDDGDIHASIRTLDETLQTANNTFASRQDIMSGTA